MSADRSTSPTPYGNNIALHVDADSTIWRKGPTAVAEDVELDL